MVPDQVIYLLVQENIELACQAIEKAAMDRAVIDVDDAQDELYCMVKVPVVGLQYYTGLVGAGEEVRLVREPHNKYDRNAIQVKNIGGTQVGHVKREYAARLAPLLDQGLITVEGVMQEGNRACSCSFLASVY